MRLDKFYGKVLIVSLSVVILSKYIHAQDSLFCFGGQSDGYASSYTSGCGTFASIFVGGFYDGAAVNASGNCSLPSTIHAGGFYDGNSSLSSGSCVPPSVITKGGNNDGFSTKHLSPCSVPPTVLNGGGYDGSGYNLLACNTVSVQSLSQSDAIKINIYPNPAADEFIFWLSDIPLKAGCITVADVSGSEVARVLLLPSVHTYSFKTIQWADGIYLLKILLGDMKLTRELVVLKDRK